MFLLATTWLGCLAAPKIKKILLSTELGPTRKAIVVIDPGHGGKDPGATGELGIHEKNVVLTISKNIYTLLNHHPGIIAKLTRDDDVFLELRDRLKLARKGQADLFIAIHADAYNNKKARGASVFALSKRGATSTAARWLAKKENDAALMGGGDLSDQSYLVKSVLLDLSQSSTIRDSLIFGNALLKSLQRVTRVHHRKVEQAGFVVLKSPDIPSLLIETGFLSNRQEEINLGNPAYQQRISRAIADGIINYFTNNPPPNTYFSRLKKSPRYQKTHP